MDVRTVNEFLNDGHAPGALNIPMHVSLEPKQENPEFMVAFENAFPNKVIKLMHMMLGKRVLDGKGPLFAPVPEGPLMPRIRYDFLSSIAFLS